MKTLKLFISQPMIDKTDQEILTERENMINRIKNCYPNNEIDVIDSFFQGAPHDAKPLWYLSKSLELLSSADIAAFATGWNKYRGCKIEHLCAKEYGIDIIDF